MIIAADAKVMGVYPLLGEGHQA